MLFCKGAGDFSFDSKRAVARFGLGIASQPLEAHDIVPAFESQTKVKLFTFSPRQAKNSLRCFFLSGRWDSNPESLDPKSSMLAVTPRPVLPFRFAIVSRRLIFCYSFKHLWHQKNLYALLRILPANIVVLRFQVMVIPITAQFVCGQSM